MRVLMVVLSMVVLVGCGGGGGDTVNGNGISSGFQTLRIDDTSVTRHAVVVPRDGGSGGLWTLPHQDRLFWYSPGVQSPFEEATVPNGDVGPVVGKVFQQALTSRAPVFVGFFDRGIQSISDTNPTFGTPGWFVQLEISGDGVLAHVYSAIQNPQLTHKGTVNASSVTLSADLGRTGLSGELVRILSTALSGLHS